jgi:hypothetical protein
MIIENWSILWSKGEDYLAPELRHKQAQGTVYGHDHFKDGTHVITSALMEINLDEKYIKTMNSCYELGEPDPDYIESLREPKEGEKE